MKSRRRRVVIAVIQQESDGALLCARRRPGKAFGGMWEVPGGVVEERDGHDLAALEREIDEELGVRAYSFSHLLVFSLDPPEVPEPLDFTVFRVWLRGEPQPLQADELRWCPLDEAAALQTTPATARVVAHLRGGL